MKPPTPRERRKELYRSAISLAVKEGSEDDTIRRLALSDLFFLGTVLLDMPFADNDWVFERCEEFSRSRDGFLDLWPREHFKSTILTLWGSIQEILRDPEITIGIFSFNRPAAKSFLRAIKWQFEMNPKLLKYFPDVLWEDPAKEAPKWSEDDGIVVRRKGLPKEMTVEASGLVDGMPTGKHYRLTIYDDPVVKDSVSTPEMIAKVTEAMAISFNLGSVQSPRRWMIGTRYHYADTWSEMIRRGAAVLRIYSATDDGKVSGNPVLWTREVLARKITDMGSYVASCQLFNNPVMEGEQTFDEAWLRSWIPRGGHSWEGMNRYILVDPANSKNKKSDYTVMAVVGLGADRNYYLIDMVRDRLSLQERATRLFSLHAMYEPICVGYEKYSMQGDIDYLKERMETEQYRFRLIPLGGNMSKIDRIRRIQPFFQEGRFYLPERLMRIDYQGRQRDLVQDFIQDEYRQFPYMTHDDMLDCIARIAEEDLMAVFPSARPTGGLPSWVEDEADGDYNNDTYAYLKRGRRTA